jgi:peptidoglycan hydrolase-like protein with peptidoglycan-binding domain
MPLDQPTLQEGDSGDAVARLQDDLITVGYLEQDADPSGQFGSATAAAVIQAQTDCGLDPNGVVDADTWFAIEGPTPTAESSFDLAEFPSLARVVAHAQDQDIDGYLADLGIAGLDGGNV